MKEASEMTDIPTPVAEPQHVRAAPPHSDPYPYYGRLARERKFFRDEVNGVPLPAWSEGLRQARFPEHLVRHLSAMAELTWQGRYDRMTDTMCKLTGEAPTNMRDFVELHAAEFKQRGPAHS
jgi:hypothetical protein